MRLGVEAWGHHEARRDYGLEAIGSLYFYVLVDQLVC